MTTEIRSIKAVPTLEDRNVTGYAALFYDPRNADTEFRSGNYVERIDPNAFKMQDWVYASLDHNDQMILDHTDATLKVSVDKRGIQYSFPLRDNDPDHQRLKAKMDNGLISGASFGMVVVDDDWKQEGKDEVRYIRSAKVLHVSPTYKGAYPAATSTLRKAGEDLEAAFLKAETQKRIKAYESKKQS